MIVFVPTSALPRPLTQAHLSALGPILGRRLRTKRVRQVGVRFVSVKQMHALNKQYRGKDRPTDVLSFESQPIPLPRQGAIQEEMGDIVICAPYAAEEAKRRKIPVLEEYMRLLVHGVLHLAGYDHATEADELTMFGIQESILEQASFQL